MLPLELDAVSFATGGTAIINDVTAHIEAGPRSVILGPNGAGKSVLMRLCHGLLTPTGGRIVWHGDRNGGVRRRQAMVFQRPVMLRRSVSANVDYALALRRVPPAERRERVAEALARTGLRRFADQPARLLSGGEQQRLALARAWVLAPQVLFLDEPTASLDPAATHAVEVIVGAFRDAGTRIVMTTHDLGQARRLADEVLFMNRGRVLEAAPAERFFAKPENDLARAFLKGELLWWQRGRDNRAAGGGGFIGDGTEELEENTKGESS